MALEQKVYIVFILDQRRDLFQGEEIPNNMRLILNAGGIFNLAKGREFYRVLISQTEGGLRPDLAQNLHKRGRAAARP